MHASERTQHLRQSDIRAISRKINAVQGINLGQGICDMPTPMPIREAAKQAIDENRSIYSHYAGTAVLRERILEKSRSYNGISLDSIEQIVVSAGSTGVYATTLLALLNPGDGVVLFEPFYGYHRDILQLFGFTPQYVPLAEPGWQFDADALRNTITKRTKAVVLTTPSNPSGKVWTRDEMNELLHIAREHELTVITDEIYEYMLYDGRKHVSFATLPGAFDRTITLSGFSKTYNMTGWRLGYASGPRDTMEHVGLINDLLYICAPTPLQHGVTAAFDMDPSYFTDLARSYDAKRTLMCTTLEQIGFDVTWPEGAYYVLASFKPRMGEAGFGDDGEAAMTLVDKSGVGTVRGASFYADPSAGSHLLRFCFAKEMPVLEDACNRLTKAFR